MVMEHSDNERGNLLCYFIHSTDSVVHTVMLSLEQEGRKEMFYLTMHSTHFIYGYMASVIW